MKGNILIVEDEVRLARYLELELTYEGYSTEKCTNGRDGLEMSLNGDFDLILLDIMLPHLNGMEVLRRLREKKDTPVIFLTARDDTFDKVSGLDLGADDYVTKPFEIDELLARIRGLLKRRARSNSSSNRFDDHLSINGLSIDIDRHVVTYKDEVVELTKKEFDLLKYFVENIGRVLSREMILEHVWGFDYYGDTNIVDVYVRYIRSKIDDRFGVKFIFTVRGVGYVLKDEK
ncbi:MAG: response regulator transcription factor [Clostridioides sp.]|jgi:DNA-binding response OmpR family regulator|nr:response regulator transcription factor [Clostridioides sp.]